MLRRRFHLFGLLAVLLALMAQLGAGASVPRVDLVATEGMLCHTDDGGTGSPSNAPSHSGDCLICPLCVALHVQPAPLVSAIVSLMPPDSVVLLKAELPPPSTAPPTLRRPPSQPRAPPTFS